LVIVGKDTKQFTCQINDVLLNEVDKFIRTLRIYAFPSTLESLFAFKHFESSLHNGTKLLNPSMNFFSIQNEYQRMGLSTGRGW